MKKIAALALLASVCFAGQAHALTNMEKSYVVNGTIGILTMTLCEAKPVKDGLVKLADRNGLDNEKLSKAVVAAMEANMNGDYDRDDLIPAVTQLLGSAIIEFSEGFAKDKKGTCSKWITVLRNNGIVQ